MFILELLARAVFRRANDGSILFYPHTSFGHGYIIPSATRYARLRQSFLTVCLIAIFLVVPAVILIFKSLLGFVILVFASVVGYFIWARLQTRNLVRV